MPFLRNKRTAGSALEDKFIWARLQLLWARIRDSLWFIPSTLTLLGAVSAITLVELERQQLVPWSSGSEHWLLGGDADGARQLLSAIVGGLMTVTGVAFSVTIVALQLASSQFTPRILRNFTADRPNQIVLGVLIGTFTYAMLVLRTVRSAGPGSEEFVPRLAVTVAVGLALISIGWLIYFIGHLAASLRVTVILERVSHETLRHIRKYFPEPYDGTWERELPDAERLPEQHCPINAGEAGYLQAVDAAALTRLARRKQLEIRMARKVGAFLLEGQPLAYILGITSADDQTIQAVREAFVLGDERTPEQDVEFGIIGISDIAVKALSPGINDPTTAIRCIDRLSQILQELGGRQPSPPQPGADGRIPFIAQHLDFPRAVGLAFDPIRHFGAANPAIVKKLIGSLMVLIDLLPSERHGVLLAQAEVVLADAGTAITTTTSGPELQRLKDEFRAVCQRAGTPAP